MDWNWTGEENIRTLRRIAALLLALAGLADRAAVRSRPVRAFVLWLLHPAGEIARDYVAKATAAPFPSQPSPILADDSPAAAMRLAMGFRALAAALATLAVEASALRPAGARAFRPALGAAAALALRDGMGLEQRLDSS